MDQIKTHIITLDKYLCDYSLLVTLEKKVKVKHTKVWAFLLFALIFGITLFFHAPASGTSNIFAILFPMGKLASGLASNSGSKLSELSVYYGLVSVWMTMELTYVFQYRIPFYWFVKCAGVFWLASDKFWGIKTVADIIRPKIIELYSAKKSTSGRSSPAEEEKKDE